MLLEHTKVADGLLGRPILIGVDHQLRLLAAGRQGIAHNADAPQIVGRVQPHLQFACKDAFGRHAGVEGPQLVVGEGHVQPAGIGAHPARGCAQRIPQGFVVEAGFQVPQ